MIKTSSPFTNLISFFLIFYLIFSSFQFTDASSVVTLTKENFDILTSKASLHGAHIARIWNPFLKSLRLLSPVVCHHPMNLIFKKKISSNAIETALNGISLGSVDCEAEKELGERFDVSAFPTLKYYRSGLATDYEGGREVSDFVRFAKRVTGPATHNIATKRDLNNLKLYPVSFLLYSKLDHVTEVFKEVAQKYQDSIHFGITNDVSLLPSNLLPEKYDFLVVWFNDAEAQTYPHYIGSLDANQLGEWVYEHRYPYFPTLDGSNWQHFVKRNLPIVIGAMDAKQMNSPLYQALKSLAPKEQEQYSFGWLDSTKFLSFIQNVVADSPLPTFFVLDAKKQIFWHDSSISHTKSQISSFLKDVSQGKIESKAINLGFFNQIASAISWFALTITEEPLYLFLTIGVITLIVCTFIWFIIRSTPGSGENDGEQVNRVKSKPPSGQREEKPHQDNSIPSDKLKTE